MNKAVKQYHRLSTTDLFSLARKGVRGYYYSTVGSYVYYFSTYDWISNSSNRVGKLHLSNLYCSIFISASKEVSKKKKDQSYFEDIYYSLYVIALRWINRKFGDLESYKREEYAWKISSDFIIRMKKKESRGRVLPQINPIALPKYFRQFVGGKMVDEQRKWYDSSTNQRIYELPILDNLSHEDDTDTLTTQTVFLKHYTDNCLEDILDRELDRTSLWKHLNHKLDNIMGRFLLDLDDGWRWIIISRALKRDYATFFNGEDLRKRVLLKLICKEFEDVVYSLKYFKN